MTDTFTDGVARFVFERASASAVRGALVSLDRARDEILGCHPYPTPLARVLSELLADNPPLGPAYGLRGMLAVESGRLTKALPDAEKAIRLSPSDFRGFLARGRIQFERGSAGALPDLNTAVELSKHSDAAGAIART